MPDSDPARASALELDAELIDRLRGRGHRVTSQRLVIHRALRSREQHLTAEGVLETVAGTLPGICLPTIYATLELFEELGVVTRVSAGGALLFDSRVSPHAHAACRRCGTLVDIDEPVQPARALRSARSAGFEAHDVQLLVWGLCGECRASD